MMGAAMIWAHLFGPRPPAKTRLMRADCRIAPLTPRHAHRPVPNAC